LIGKENLKKALFPDDEETQKKIIEVREEILAVEKVVDPLAAKDPATATQTNNNSTAILSPSSTSNMNSAREINNGMTPPLTPGSSRSQNQQNPPLSPVGSASSSSSHQKQQQGVGVVAASPLLDDDVPRDQENADFSFLTFDRFYLAVVLFEPNSQVASTVINRNPQAKDLPLNERKVVLPLKIEKLNNVNNEIPYQVTATCSYYLYEQATEETVSCLRVRKATQEANAASPLVKLSNFAKNLFK